jgi:hypothetical protein
VYDAIKREERKKMKKQLPKGTLKEEKEQQ